MSKHLLPSLRESEASCRGQSRALQSEMLVLELREQCCELWGPWARSRPAACAGGAVPVAVRPPSYGVAANPWCPEKWVSPATRIGIRSLHLAQSKCEVAGKRQRRSWRDSKLLASL